MRERMRCEFGLLRYVPDVVSGEFANIGVLLRDEQGKMLVRLTRDWSRVRCLDRMADLEMLESLEAEIMTEIERATVDGYPKPFLERMKDSFSTSVQITEMKGTLAESLAAEMESLLRMYVEPRKAARAAVKKSGRAAIVEQMRTEFERAGVWGLMRKKIAAAQYTQAGDPLKLDCGYRNGQVRMFQAISLERDAEAAKGLAYSAGPLRAGVRRIEGAELELTAVVESISTVHDHELYAFGLRVLENESVRVLTVADLGPSGRDSKA